MTILRKVLDIVPGWVWLAFIVLLGMGNLSNLARMKAAQADAATARETLTTERNEHLIALTVETEYVLRLERQLKVAVAAVEENDERSKATIEALTADLRGRTRAAGGPGLRDPHARTCRSYPAPSGAAAVAQAGAGDGADAPGLLSPELERLLLDQARIAEGINAAYASCRTDPVNRQRLLLSPTSVDSSASPVEP